MTTIAATVPNMRRMLKDKPVEDYITAAIASSSATTMTVNNAALFAKGNVWEFDDGATGAEQILVRDVDTATSIVTMKRGHNGSTAATHLINTVLLKEPRFPFDELAQAINWVVDANLFDNGIFDIIEHIVTSSATTNAYNQPSSSCERPLSIYQRVNTTDEITYLSDWNQRYFNADTSLYANGGYIVIRENIGTPGTTSYYINCAHKHTIATVSTKASHIIEAMGCYYLLTWEDVRRTAGPTNQGDRSVRPMDSSRLSLFFKSEADRLIKEEAAYISDRFLYPSTRRFVRRSRK